MAKKKNADIFEIIKRAEMLKMSYGCYVSSEAYKRDIKTGYYKPKDKPPTKA